MISLLILLGLIPAGLMIVGDDTDDGADDTAGSAGTGTAASPPVPLDKALSPPDATPDPLPPGPEQPDLTAPPLPAQPVTLFPDLATPAPDLLLPDGPEGAIPTEAVPYPPPAPPDAPLPLPPSDAGGEGQPLTPEPAADTGADEPDEAPAPEDAPEAGEDISLGPEDGDQTVEGFRPGEDLLTIAIEDDEVVAFRSLHPDTGAVQLRLYGDEGEQVITFAGLSHLPVGDIFLSLTDPATGAQIIHPLAAFLFRDEDALDPLRPDEPGVVTPPDPEQPPDPGLDPVPADPVYELAAALTPSASQPASPANTGPEPLTSQPQITRSAHPVAAT